VLTLAYGDGSLATVSYAEHGHVSTAKERLEILGRGHSVTIDDYKGLTIDGGDVKMMNPDKGHVRNLERFRAVVRGEADGTVDLSMSIATTATMLEATSSLTTLNATALGDPVATPTAPRVSK
jgi:hypothetical protein